MAGDTALMCRFQHRPPIISRCKSPAVTPKWPVQQGRNSQELSDAFEHVGRLSRTVDQFQTVPTSKEVVPQMPHVDTMFVNHPRFEEIKGFEPVKLGLKL